MTAHRLLVRQLRRLGVEGVPDAEQWAAVLDVVSRTYADHDDDRYLLERSVEVSSAEMRGLHQELRRQALEDPLTRLPNRAALIGELGRALDRARAGGPGVALLFLDLDGFKAVNDRFGHAAGDDLLVQVAGRITGCLRADDVVARLGGDEFVVVCADGGRRDDALRLATRIAAAVAAPVVLAAGSARVSASIGVALTGDGRTPADALLMQADAAMYRAKALGKSRTVLADQTPAPV